MATLTSGEFVATLQKAVIALGNSLGGKTLVLDGKAWKEADLAEAIQAVIDALNAVVTARNAWIKAAADAAAAKASIVPIMAALQAYIRAVYGTGSNVYSEFGFTARKQGKPGAITAAARVIKNLATRKARMTMGKKQKQGIKGVVTSNDVQTVVAAAAGIAPAIQVVAPAVPSNVPGTSNAGTNGSNRAH